MAESITRSTESQVIPVAKLTEFPTQSAKLPCILPHKLQRQPQLANFAHSMNGRSFTLTFLGTGTSQGVPVIACDCAVCTSKDPRDQRLRSSVLLSMEGKNYSIDAGPDFRQQMLRAQVKTLEAVVFTHEHKDHIAGLDDVRAYNYSMHQDMRIFGNERVEEALKRDFHYAFTDTKYPGVPQLDFQQIGTDAFELDGIQWQPIEVMHFKLPVLGFRVGDLTYITDAKTISEGEKEKIRGSKTLVINALRPQEHISHLNLQQALDLIDELEVETAYLTHLSHLMGLHADLSPQLPSHVFAAYDGLQIQGNL